MKIRDIRKTSLTVYRASRDGVVRGYALHPVDEYECEAMVEVDPDVDHVGQIQVHVFGTRREANAFLEGLSHAGEDPALSFGELCADGWAVLREVNHEPDIEDDPTVRVFIHSERPHVLITVRGGVAARLTDDPDLDVCIVDFDNDPGAALPDRFKGLMRTESDS